MSTRGLDHLVLPVAGLDASRARLERLGFTVAPQGTHPFGTINACVYFADGTFIEPLTVGDAAIADAAVAAGNSFVAGDRRFRETRGEEGLSGLVFTTGDAEADHAEFSRLGMSGGPMVEFSRPSMDPDGKADIASFLLAFAAPEGGADAFFFACERRKVPAIDRSALERHANGATRIAAVAAEAADPARFAAFLAAAGRADATQKGGTTEVALANTVLRVAASDDAVRPRLGAIAFGVRSLDGTRALFNANGIGYDEREKRLHVPPASGQGVEFVFEETP
ncbi:MAG: VOC family protein [Aquamicrobium sp.]|uniref:VOC family protein n=1 Tax=Aquamicrobium sp. TaxID=1872579 RepID=UPI00349E56BD|nr:VOC family protein [Aquamicrobium sp.]